MPLADGRAIRLPVLALALFTAIAVTIHFVLSRSESNPIPGDALVLLAAIHGAIIRSLFYGAHGAPPGDLNDWVLACGSSLVWTLLVLGLGVGIRLIVKHVRQGAA